MPKASQITPAQAAKELLARRNARRDLLSFTEYTHPNWTSGRHHRKICDLLMAILRGEVKRAAIFCPPRHSKSELASKRFPAFALGMHPEWQIIGASHTAQLAQDFGAEVRDIVGSPEYQRLYPGTHLHPDAQAAGRWRTTEGGIYVSVGVDGTCTGRGANLLAIDDPVKGRNDAESPRMRELAWRWYMGDAYQRLMPDGAILLMMTRWHEDDLAARMLAAEGFHILELPAIAHEGTDQEEALWPEWWPLEVLREKRATMVKGNRMRDWQAQYQQNPKPAQGTYILRKWLEDARYGPEDLPAHLNKYGSTDPAVTAEEEGQDPDYTEHGIWGMSAKSEVFALDWWAGQVTADKWIAEQHRLAVKHKPLAWFNEAGVIRRATEPLRIRMSREAGVHIREQWIPSVANKEIRGRSLQALASAGKFRFPKNCAWADRVIDQLVGFPSVRHDDAFDTCSIMALAIDNAHPAIVPIEDTTVRDPYAEDSGMEDRYTVI